MSDAPALRPDFPEHGHAILRRLRENHFWFSHRRDWILRVAGECLAGREQPRLLEFGCGDGDVLSDLSEHWWTAGLERRVDDLRLARSRKAQRVVAAEGGSPPFLRTFDLVGLFDVVEHVDDDAGLLRRASELAVDGGWILVTVPADPRLWSTLDVYAGHHRRYTRAMLEQLFEKAGLRVEKVRPLFRMLWPLGRLRAALFGRRPVVDPEAEYRVASWINRFLTAALAVEGKLGGGSSWGTGTSWIAAARVNR